MKEVRTLYADNTHLFPGARLAFADAQPAPDAPTEAMIVFTDSSRAEATLDPSDSTWLLRVESYTTAAGTVIEAKSWGILISDERMLTVSSRGGSSRG
ncbi:MAG: hypothetical protein R2722_05330 [Tessaracoccus sp.]